MPRALHQAKECTVPHSTACRTFRALLHGSRLWFVVLEFLALHINLIFVFFLSRTLKAINKPCFASSSSWVSWGFFSSTTTQGGAAAGLGLATLFVLSWHSLLSSSSSLSSSNLTRFFSRGSRSFSLALMAKLIGANEAAGKR